MPFTVETGGRPWYARDIGSFVACNRYGRDVIERSAVNSALTLPVFLKLRLLAPRPPASSFRELLYCLSSIFWANGVCPGLIGLHCANEGIGENEDLAGDGDESDFGGFAAGLEAAVEVLHFRTVADGDNCRLIETDAHGSMPKKGLLFCSLMVTYPLEETSRRRIVFPQGCGATDGDSHGKQEW